MLYAVFMSRPLSPLPKPQEPQETQETRELSAQPVLLAFGTGEDGPCLRADAARNRARLLDAAARLVAEHGAAGVTMEAVAAAAEVGKGTVFRRFGDRTGLLRALLDHSERKFQAAFLSGPPPMGPGAPPAERLRAFGCVALRRAAADLELQLAADPGPARRFVVPARQVQYAHVAMLLRQAVPDADSELLAHTLMGYLEPALIHHLTRQCQMPMERLQAGWHDLVARITSTEPHC
ncbi:TetR/AcrR family transcriptional regulator [Streptomyces cyslabdanicus]|uniref:TetR/AcrR family transcriptional regulator n=1 Tax=Streptomyces cyslabdanicus TaxID=1470456 RepID=UPI0040441B66